MCVNYSLVSVISYAAKALPAFPCLPKQVIYNTSGSLVTSN